MKKKLIKISVAVSCLALAAVMAMPALANTMNINGNLYSWQGKQDLAYGSKDAASATNMVVEVDTLGNSNDYANFEGHSCAGTEEQCTDDFIVAVNGKANANYYSPTNWTGGAKLYGWAQIWGPGTTAITGAVAFH